MYMYIYIENGKSSGSTLQEHKEQHCKIFLHLLSKHFPKNRKKHKMFNRNTVQISYSCIKNIGSIISAHNRNVLKPTVRSYGCNCRSEK